MSDDQKTSSSTAAASSSSSSSATATSSSACASSTPAEALLAARKKEEAWTVDIHGLDKVTLLREMCRYGYVSLWACAMSDFDTTKAAVAVLRDIDYFQGCLIKCDLSGSKAFSRWYDEKAERSLAEIVRGLGGALAAPDEFDIPAEGVRLYGWGFNTPYGSSRSLFASTRGGTEYPALHSVLSADGKRRLAWCWGCSTLRTHEPIAADKLPLRVPAACPSSCIFQMRGYVLVSSSIPNIERYARSAGKLATWRAAWEDDAQEDSCSVDSVASTSSASSASASASSASQASRKKRARTRR